MTQATSIRAYGSRMKHAVSRAFSGAKPKDSSRHVRLFPAEMKIPMPDERLRGTVGRAAAFEDVALVGMGRMNVAGLRPDHDVLDIGCGVGRTARYLCDYLDKDARYEGFDVVEETVRWCETAITPLFPNFHFTYTPLFNQHYSSDPTLPSAAAFEFPYPDQSFDFAFAHSVFTHLMPDASEQYLREIKRVLRPGGISYTTWFLLNDEPSGYAHSQAAHMVQDPSRAFAARDPDVPEAGIGYQEHVVREAHASSGLSILEPIHPGFNRMQDLIVAVR